MEQSIAIYVIFQEWIAVKPIKIWQKNQSRNPYVKSNYDDSQIFLTNEKVPRIIRDEDKSNNIISFSRQCIQGQLLRSDFPPRMSNENHLECHKCNMNNIDCAYELFWNHSGSVVRLYSINSNVLVQYLYPFRPIIENHQYCDSHHHEYYSFFGDMYLYNVHY